jgi:acetoacetyl-CoA synthetase
MTQSQTHAAPIPSPIRESDLLWTPTPAQAAQTNVTTFIKWLAETRGKHFANYSELWQWSVTSIQDFWQSLWDYFSVQSSAKYDQVLNSRTMPGAQWFPGARLNYAQHVLRHERPNATALYYLTETIPLTAISWESFATQVRILATQLRNFGIRPGDRVAAYMPNIPQTMVAMLATTAIGAIWSCCSPDFGSRGAIDRIQQLSPKLFFCVDGYRYGGKPFDRSNEVAQIVATLPDLKKIIFLSYLDPQNTHLPSGNSELWNSVMNHDAISAGDFQFEQLPFDHPLWVLFSSGTTGLPKAIVHGHGGILLEQLKLQTFHMDFHPDECAFFFTTSGWMMWNMLASFPLTKTIPVLYDGHPAYPSADVLWKVVQDCRASFFGASPSYVDLMKKSAIALGEKFNLSHLRAVMPAGSTVSPECTAWFYNNVKKDLWVATGSGGTDCCTGFVGGVPTLPVYAGEIQARSLGVAIESFDENGRLVTGEVGEMVITQPLPSMPLYFWNDPDGARYRESYFEHFPGVWRHGDFLRINQRGGCFVDGRSDATLNRQGIRIGTAEIYRALATLPEIDDALVVNLDLPNEKFFMPLFVKLNPGYTLDPALEHKICAQLKREYSPRHVPDRILETPEIPATLTGKKMEVAVRKILLGIPADKAANRDAMANPHALDFFSNYAKTQTDYTLQQPAEVAPSASNSPTETPHAR